MIRFVKTTILALMLFFVSIFVYGQSIIGLNSDNTTYYNLFVLSEHGDVVIEPYSGWVTGWEQVVPEYAAWDIFSATGVQVTNAVNSEGDACVAKSVNYIEMLDSWRVSIKGTMTYYSGSEIRVGLIDYYEGVFDNPLDELGSGAWVKDIPDGVFDLYIEVDGDLTNGCLILFNNEAYPNDFKITFTEITYIPEPE